MYVNFFLWLYVLNSNFLISDERQYVVQQWKQSLNMILCIKEMLLKSLMLTIPSYLFPKYQPRTLDTNLLTYLIGHNNPINGFRLAATLPSRRFCSLRGYASWLHQSMTGLPRFDLFNGCRVVLFADFRRSPHQIPVSPEHPPPYERHGRASAAAGY